MLKCQIFRFVFIILFISHYSIVSKTIHILGDSHAPFCFREGLILSINFLQKMERFELPVTIYKRDLKIPFIIHWLGPITMHRVGRDGLQFLNVKNFNVQENDIVVFVFGEIDVRCHIGKQRDIKKRKLKEIIDILATKYIETIKENQKQFDELTCVICCIIPPIDGLGRNNPEYPFYGELSDRITIARCLNKKLQELCIKNNLLFLDFYDLYADFQGSLNVLFADPIIHIDSIYNRAIKQKLIELVADHFIQLTIQ
jgi:hypothetical protein